jgi:beta-lactamase superfamily II metal-dependent hydrolase
MKNKVFDEGSDLIIVYIEKVEEDGRYLLVDFPEKSYFQKFLRRVAIIDVGNDERSMIEIKGLNFAINQKPKEGCYYCLPEKVINTVDWLTSYQTITDNESHSSIIAFRVDLTKYNLTVHFGKAIDRKVIFGKFYQEKESEAVILDIPELDCIESNFNGTKLVAMKVGQGNWNEIHFNDGHNIIFDLGVSNKFDIRRTNIVIRSSKIFRILDDKMSLEKTTIIISHWDVDHYQAIFQIGDDDLKKIRKIIYPSDPPSQTAKRAFSNKIEKNFKGRMLEISPAISKGGKGSTSVLHCIFKKQGISLFKGTKSSNRNKSGLSLCVWTNSAIAILPADHHYDQINKFILEQVPKNLKTFLIVPHHGGNAGDYKLIQKIRIPEVAILSVGKNPYKHPLKEVCNELRQFNKVYNIESEDKDFVEFLK